MSLLRLKSVIWYCKRYTDAFYVEREDRWNLYKYLLRISDEMIENDTLLSSKQARKIAVRVWTFANQVAHNLKDVDKARLERMCLSDQYSGIFEIKEKWRVRDMGEMVSYLDGGEMQTTFLSRLMSLMVNTVADAIEREAPGFFHPEQVLAAYCKHHLDSHNDESRAKIGWSELGRVVRGSRYLNSDQAIGFAVESWRISQQILRANVDELEEIATKPVFITDQYISQNDTQRIMDPVYKFLWFTFFGPDRERCESFLAWSMKVCADSLLLTKPEMFDKEAVIND